MNTLEAGMVLLEKGSGFHMLLLSREQMVDDDNDAKDMWNLYIFEQDRRTWWWEHMLEDSYDYMVVS